MKLAHHGSSDDSHPLLTPEDKQIPTYKIKLISDKPTDNSQN